MPDAVTIQATQTIAEVKDSTANPAPLGLLGFGMTTVLLNIHNAGFYGMDSMIFSIGLSYGGVAQIIAGVMEWKKKHVWNHRFYFVRLILAYSGGAAFVAQNGLGRASGTALYGSVPICLGSVYGGYVYRNLASE
mgnify:CR=1 FL=1